MRLLRKEKVNSVRPILLALILKILREMNTQGKGRGDYVWMASQTYITPFFSIQTPTPPPPSKKNFLDLSRCITWIQIEKLPIWLSLDRFWIRKLKWIRCLVISQCFVVQTICPTYPIRFRIWSYELARRGQRKRRQLSKWMRVFLVLLLLLLFVCFIFFKKIFSLFFHLS